MQETKYFTPDIEDIRHGYECEVQLWNKTWQRTILEEDGVDTSHMRVPYLTKEQVEKEGWKCFVHNEETTTWAASKNNVSFITEDTRILSMRDKGNKLLFRGECKDINTFRFICKLLGI